MPDIFVDYSHKCPTALARMVKLLKASGSAIKLMMAMPSDRAAVDGSSFMDSIGRANPGEIPDHLAEWLVAINATLTVSHDVGIGHFRAADDSKCLFSLKSFLDGNGFAYVITHVDTGVTITDLSGVTEF